MIVLRFLWMVVSFLLVEALVFLPLFLFGALTFPAFYRWAPRRVTVSEMTHLDKEGFTWRWLDEVLGNREDGLWPDWWKLKGGTAYGWFLRNPVTNMRFWPLISTRPDPLRLGYVGTINHVPTRGETGWFFCWQGGYGGFCYQGASFGCWFGWKTNPRDVDWIWDYRWEGLGLALQLWRVEP